MPNSAVAFERTNHSRTFNDDLLLNAGDLQYAKSQFPACFDVFDHAELRAEFRKYETAANNARTFVRSLGFLTVIAAAIALLSAATESLWDNLTYAATLRIVFELCGLIAAIIAGTSLWLGPWRKEWLESRFMTERLRQWHFQLLVRKGAEIEGLVTQHTPDALESFRLQRSKWFKDFLHECEGKIDSRLEAFANDPDFANDWLHGQTAYRNNTTTLASVFEAYQRLRLSHQYDYATYKLTETTDRPIWRFLEWPLLLQESAVRSVVSFCFIAALLCSMILILNGYFEVRPDIVPYLASSTLVIAIVGVAFRTLQEGLGIAKDIERYRDYRGKVRRLLLRCQEPTDQQRKLRIMEEMEVVAVDELRAFLRTHRNAAFLL